MWLLGLLVGAVVGGLLGHGSGALAGAIVGTVAGAVYRSRHGGQAQDEKSAARRLAELERKVDHIYKSLEDIHWRLRKLEQPDAVTEQHPVASATTMDAAVPEGAARVDAVDAEAPLDTTQDTALPGLVAPAVSLPVANPGEGKTTAAQHPQAADAPVQKAALAANVNVAPPIDTVSPANFWQRLLAGNIVAKVGALVLFFGVGFLLKYAYEHAVLPVPVRLAAVALAGLALLAAGWRLSMRRRLYGLILQGAGIGVLYLDVFFALRVFALIHPGLGFALFMLLGVAATLMAVRQDAKVLAVVGLTGAFLAPILAGSEADQPVALFSYYTLLNAFILAISWFKAWRDLNLTGFIFTFVAGVFWGQAHYRPELFATIEPFVLLFFAMYLVIPILFAQRQPLQLRGLVDGTLVFGTPLSVAFMQAGLVRDLPYGLAWSAGLGAALYALLAVMVLRREGLRLLGEAYLALAVVLATMALFFALDAYPTFALWTLEGAAIVWMGLRQSRLFARLFGLLLQCAGACLFLMHDADYDRTQPWFNDFVLGCALITVAALITAWLMHKYREVLHEAGEAAPGVILLWAFGWWFAGGWRALHDGLQPQDAQAAAVMFAAVSFALAETIGGWLGWKALRLITRAHLPLIALGILGLFANGQHPLAGLGLAAWPLAFAVFFWCLHWQAQDAIATVHGARYRSGWVLMAALATWEGLWLFDHRHFAGSASLGLFGLLAGALRYRLRERENVAATAVSHWVLLWGLGFWLVSGLAYINWHHDPDLHIAYGLGLVAATALLFEIFGGWIDWTAARRIVLLLPLAMVVALYLQIHRQLHPAADLAWAAWGAAIAALFYILRCQRRAGISLGADAQTVFAVWLSVGLLAWELAWRCALAWPASSWAFAMWGAVPATALLVLDRWSSCWWRGDDTASRDLGLGALAAFVASWSVWSSGDVSVATPWPFWPLINPVDLAQIVVLMACYGWARAPRSARQSRFVMLAVLGFVWLNAVLLRCIHHWYGVPYAAVDLFNSMTVQMTLSIVWTLTALIVMWLATRGLRRSFWLAGAALLAAAVGKLFLLDLASVGTVERIVSFLVVGGLLMIIGYVAPVPPGEIETQTG